MTKSGLLAKIGLFAALTSILISCNAVKRVPEGKKLLVKNHIVIDSIPSTDGAIYNLLTLKPNTRIMGIPMGVHIYSWARKDRDSIFAKWLKDNPKKAARRDALLSRKQHLKLGASLVAFNRWLKKTGQEPAIINETDIALSKERIKAYYWSQGWFNLDVDHKITIRKARKRADVTYYITRHKEYLVDSLTHEITSPIVDSLYQQFKQNSYLVAGNTYRTADVTAERERLNRLFRNNGIYHMDKEYIQFEGDTVNTDHKARIKLIISNREIKSADSIIEKPFKQYTISRINIYPDYQNNLEGESQDTTYYNGYYIIRNGKARYKNKVLTDALFIHEGDIYRDIDRARSYRRITELKSFLYPSIRYIEDPADSTGHSLIANVLLTSKEKVSLKFAVESTHSNIQTLGIGVNPSVVIRNLFRGSELLDINFRGSIGASANTASGDSRFFDLQEYGADARLSFPRLFLPFKTDKFIPKYMSPSTKVSLGFFSQTNIGLDKTSVTGALSYGWIPKPANSAKFDLINAQYVRNLDAANFYNVYNNTYNGLNNIATDLGITNPVYLNDNGNLSIPEGTRLFTQDLLNGNIAATNEQVESVRNLEERRERLTQNNLIISSSYSWIKNTQKGIYDDDYSSISVRLEAAGNTLAGITSLIGADRNENGNREAFGVEFSQYVKTEIDYIKHWQLFNKNVFAIRAFGGVAIPYGNSNSIPFIRSFFAGGPNDNRAWQAYELGPGTTGGLNDFNEANMKIALNGEFRFTIAGAFKGALFVDAGNIWNVLDNEDDPKAQFRQLSDFTTLAVGSGLGIRYDFDYFVLRFDAGFKTFNPALEKGRRWFKEMSLSKAVLNVGINYPF